VRCASLLATALLVLAPAQAMSQDATSRPRARDIGLAPGVFQPGPNNAITDVDGVRVGQTTVIEGDNVRTGVTAILPHGGNPYLSRVPAAIYVGNGFGKLAGVTQVQELGELETPILLTCTLCVWKAADAMVAWLLERDGMERVRSINPVVGETNDSGLNDIRSSLPPKVPWRRVPWVPAPGRRPLGGRAGSAPAPASSPSRWAAGRWACWSNPTSAGSCRWAAPPWAWNWANTRSPARCSGPVPPPCRRHPPLRAGPRRPGIPSPTSRSGAPS